MKKGSIKKVAKFNEAIKLIENYALSENFRVRTFQDNVWEDCIDAVNIRLKSGGKVHKKFRIELRLWGDGDIVHEMYKKTKHGWVTEAFPKNQSKQYQKLIDFCDSLLGTRGTRGTLK
ncbi:MAG: hypothetical protein M3Z26_00425 [Bacteroidota bacterium]|nr:hypothetical protein [Bacteroidota bacterium]